MTVIDVRWGRFIQNLSMKMRKEFHKEFAKTNEGRLQTLEGKHLLGED